MQVFRSHRFLFPFSVILATTLLCGTSSAENEGLEELEKAIEAKLAAQGLDELTSVIKLLDSAIGKGLDKDNTEFAEQLLAASLLERATMISSLILDRRTPDRRWPQIRNAAVVDLKRVLILDENQPPALMLFGRLLALPGGDREVAKKSFDKVLESDAIDEKTKAKALIYRGNVQSDDDARLADYNRAVELLPEDAEIIRTRAMFHLQNDRHTEALDDFNKALSIDDEHAPTHEARGLALLMMDKYDDALAAFDRAAELMPKSALPHQNRARALALQGKTDDALAALDKAVELNPKALAALLLRAQLLLTQGKIDEALEAVEAVLVVQPGLVQAIRMKAEILAGTGRVDEAISTLQELRKHVPKNADVLMQLAMYYMVENKSRKAIDVLSDVVRQNPDNGRALRGRADALLNIGEHAKALADYERAVEVLPEDSSLLNNLAWLLATSPHDDIRDGKRAVELATKACDLTDNKAAHILSTLAAAYAESGDFDNAIKWATKAVGTNLAEQDDEGNTLDPNELTQLEKELASYKKKKPWRERQEEKPSDDDDEDKTTPDEQQTPERTIDF